MIAFECSKIMVGSKSQLDTWWSLICSHSSHMGTLQEADKQARRKQIWNGPAVLQHKARA